MFASSENNAENVYFFYFQVISVETDLAGKFLPGRQCSSCWQTNLIATLLPMLANQYYCNSAPQSSCQLTNIITTLLLMLANQYYCNSSPHASKQIVLQLCSSCWKTNIIATLLLMLAYQYYCSTTPHASIPILLQH